MWVNWISFHVRMYVVDVCVYAHAFRQVCACVCIRCACMKAPAYIMFDQVCTYRHICTHLSFMCISACIPKHTYIHAHTHTCIHTYIHICKYMHTYIHRHNNSCVFYEHVYFMQQYTHTHTHTRCVTLSTHIHALHTHIHTYIHPNPLHLQMHTIT